MANGKAMASPGVNPNRDRDRAAMDLEAVEAKFRKINAKIAELNKRAEEALAAPRWRSYAAGAVGLGVFGLGAAALSAVLF